MTLRDTLKVLPDHDRMLDGQLGFAVACPQDDPASYPGYWIWSGRFLYRNGQLWSTVSRYWYDRDLNAWWVEYWKRGT